MMYKKIMALPISSRLILDTAAIYGNLKKVQRVYPSINRTVNCARDEFSDLVINNLMTAYEYINYQMLSNKNQDISSDNMLQLNYRVHMGNSRTLQLEYSKFIANTNDKFFLYIGKLMQWYSKKSTNPEDPYATAAGLYVRILARPQLFIDGNHRTGALVASYELLLSNENPFILTPENAITFFNLASDIKFLRTDLASRFRRLIHWQDEQSRMRDFLYLNTTPFTRYATSEEMANPDSHVQFARP